MINTDPRENVSGGAYAPPSLAELVESAAHLGLVDGYDQGPRGIRIQVVGQVFDATPREAEMLVTGLLLGYFALQNSDDLTAANWNE